MQRPLRVLLVATHPVQYAVPAFRIMAKDPRVEIQVVFCSMQGAESEVDSEFGVNVKWDIPLLEGFPWVCLPNRLGKPRLGAFFGLCNPGIWKLIRSRKVEAVILNTGYRYATYWLAIAAAKASGVPVFFGTDATSLQPRDRKRWKKPLKRLLLPAIYRLNDIVVVSSEAGRQFILSLGIPESRIVMAPQSVDNTWWQERASEVDRGAVRREWGIPEDAVVAVFCAKLQPWKRPLDAMHAFAKANVKDAYLVFAGEGPLRASLEAEARALGIIERTRFLGFVNQTGLPRVYRSSDLMIMPSEYDPCPYVVCEAMLCGCPVALSDEIRGRFDIVNDGVTGFIYPCGNIEALARILSDTLGNSEKLKQLGRTAMKRMTTWSPRECVDATVLAVARVCNV
jgi:glycosyltransferase involved in cell wall biosynthesis